MGIIVDLIIVALLGLSTFLGYKQGLVGVAYKILSFIIALVLAFVLSGPVSNFIIENTEFDEGIHQTIQGALESKNVEENAEEVTEEESNVSAVITDYVAKEIKKATAETQNQVANTVATSVTNNIVYAITFIGIFIIARIILFVLKFLAEAIAELPIIKQFNEAGGVLYGILRGVFIIYLFFAIVSVLASFINMDGFLELINSSFIGGFAYNNNLLLKILF